MKVHDSVMHMMVIKNTVLWVCATQSKASGTVQGFLINGADSAASSFIVAAAQGQVPLSEPGLYAQVYMALTDYHTRPNA